MDKRFSKTEALKLIREITVTGSILPSAHVKERMKERYFDMQDVLNCISTGRILKEPEQHEVSGHWIYQVEGQTVDGDNLRIPVDIDKENNRLIIVTGIVG